MSKDLKKKIPNLNRYEQARLVILTVRKLMGEEVYFHNYTSVSFYKEFAKILYSLDNRVGNIYKDAKDLFNKYGISDKYISEDIDNLLKHEKLEDMALASADILVKLKKKKTSKQPEIEFKTWSKYAFSPLNNKNSNISELLRWKEIKDKYSKNERDDIFEILCNYFEKNKIDFPQVVNIYKDYLKQNSIYYIIKKDKDKEIKNIISEEMILSFISNKYIKELQSIKKDEKYKKDFFDFENYEYKNDNSPLKMKLIYDLNPKIEIKIKDYMKRDVRTALNWIFDAYRIKEEGRIKDKEELQQCLSGCLNSYRIIRNHEVLKSKCPKPTSNNINKNVLNGEDIKEIVHILRWAQKELLYYICNIEADIIFLLYQLEENKLISKEQIEEWKNMGKHKEDKNEDNNEDKDGYFNFTVLIDAYNQNIEKIKTIKIKEDPKNKDKKDNKPRNLANNRAFDHRLRTVRNMLAHGRLEDKNQCINYSTVISVLDDSLKAVFNKGLKDYYNPEKVIKNDNDNNNFKNKNKNKKGQNKK